ncbi:MAG: hypothetical protein MJ231_03780 [bacterium]|nr:hypothetical protein [bacterium]
MTTQFVLVSDDKDFFNFMLEKLASRKSDEFLLYSFDDVINNAHLLKSSIIIINSESDTDKTTAVLKIFREIPTIVFLFNENYEYITECYKYGMFDYITPLTSDVELQAKLIPALTVASILSKKNRYRDILVKNNIISDINEVFLDYNFIIDKELEKLQLKEKKAVFVAISPHDKEKFLFQTNHIETIILNNIRMNDILINYAPNKYFLFLFDVDMESAKKIWNKISTQFPLRIYAGFCQIYNQKREQLISEALNKLHEAINIEKDLNVDINNINTGYGKFAYTNFKLFRQEFRKKIEKVISPVFYQIQQKYSEKLSGITIQQGSGDGYGTFNIEGKFSNGSFKITSPGFSKINIDITLQRKNGNIDAKRITLEPDELEQGLLEDLLEQFISEYTQEGA